MEDHENIFDKIKELLGSLPGRMNIMEEMIDLDLQLEYFEDSKRLRSTSDISEIPADTDKLFEDEISDDEKKLLLLKIASVEKAESYRIIEKFLKNDPGELRDWGRLALQENRMLLESKLLDENHVFISTGLGGKGDRLRYFIVIFGKQISSFSDLHKKIIRNEFEISSKKFNAEIEDLKFSESIAAMYAMVPLNVTIKQIFTEAISECNLYGDFLIPEFIITNVKALSFDEIREYIKSKRKYNPGRDFLNK
ncbi:MAG: hypothetical protein H6538_06435 [Bacteroidales bacterium]|nr:hypothetical protein [Bacteroidales bacterium]MCB9012858.1 hypothetical protein [Bacteroidales bacterium]